MKPKAGSLKKINKIKPSVRLTKRKTENTNCQNQEWKKGYHYSKGYHYWPSRVKKDYRTILWTTLSHKIKQLRWRGQIPRHTQINDTKGKKKKKQYIWVDLQWEFLN